MPKNRFPEWVERHGLALRARIGLGDSGPLDPFVLATGMYIQVTWPSEIRGLSTKHLQQLTAADWRSWSAGSIELPNGLVVVVLNPRHSQNRQRATLMEEIAHIYLEHKPSRISLNENGLPIRSYKKSQETQAYWVGAAALVPRSVLRRALSDGRGVSAISALQNVSIELVNFRLKASGLWADWQRS